MNIIISLLLLLSTIYIIQIAFGLILLSDDVFEKKKHVKSFLFNPLYWVWLMIRLAGAICQVIWEWVIEGPKSLHRKYKDLK